MDTTEELEDVGESTLVTILVVLAIVALVLVIIAFAR